MSKVFRWDLMCDFSLDVVLQCPFRPGFGPRFGPKFGPRVSVLGLGPGLLASDGVWLESGRCCVIVSVCS